MLGLLFHIDPHQEEFLQKNSTPTTNNIDFNFIKNTGQFLSVHETKLFNEQIAV